MSEPRVIRADYTNWRPVAGRKVLQLILEVPIEQTADVMEKLGFPLPGESKWVAVALLDEKPSSPHSLPISGKTGEAKLATAPANDGIAGSIAKERRPFKSLAPSAQAAMACSDPSFRRWLVPNQQNVDAEMTTDILKARLGIKSRRELDMVSDTRWDSLYAEYQAFLTTQRYAEAAR